MKDQFEVHFKSPRSDILEPTAQYDDSQYTRHSTHDTIKQAQTCSENLFTNFQRRTVIIKVTRSIVS